MSSDDSRLRLRKDNFSWFNVSNYDRSKLWGIADWSGAFSIRYMLRGLLNKGEGLSLSEDNRIERILVQLLINPVANDGGRRGGLLSRGNSRVWDKTVVDVWDDWFRFERKELSEVRLQCEDWYRKIDEESNFPELPSSLNQGFVDLKRKTWPNSLNPDYEQVYVDLLTTDDQLISDFKQWLENKRKTQKKAVPKKTISPSAMADWYRYRVLAYIDLQLVCHVTGTAISNATVGALLFPDEYDVDLSERVRKVVKPLAEEVFNSDFLSAIDDQAARVE